MNSGELTVDVPLATVESDCEDSLESNRSQQNQLQQVKRYQGRPWLRTCIIHDIKVSRNVSPVSEWVGPYF
jgi:hypothetical protein